MKFLTLITTLITFQLFAAGFLPENNLERPVTDRSDGGKLVFEKAMSDVREIYLPILREDYGKGIDLTGNWESKTVNAYTSKSSYNMVIRMFGGLFRHELVTTDGFIAVICHEIGHNIGGIPKYARYGYPEWAAAEGQSDYYATSKCTKKVFEKDIENTLEMYRKVPFYDMQARYARQSCIEVFENEKDAAICYRSAMAGLSLGRLLGSFYNKEVYFNTPSKTKVKETNVKGYPDTQCRLDTYFQGALCDNDFDQLASETDEMDGYCESGIGSRPACWYKY